MEDNTKTLPPRTQRVIEIYKESGLRNYASFARETKINQPTMSNYMQGLREPSDRSLDLILKRFPEYNRLWLFDGVGEKLNQEYVAPFDPDKHFNNESSLLVKLNAALEKVVALMEKCASQEEQIKKYEELIKQIKQ